jgi:hypothetical protein
MQDVRLPVLERLPIPLAPSDHQDHGVLVVGQYVVNLKG